MDFIFNYILISWKNSRYDNQILQNVLFNENFRILNEKYYLADIKYHNID